MAVSPDNPYLYVTSRIDTGDPSTTGNICNGFAQGSFSVIDITSLTHGLSHPILSHTFADCGPVCVALSSSGTLHG